MPKKVTPEQRDAVLRMLAQGQDRDTIAVAVGVTPGQVSAISAHVRMGTYTHSSPPPDKAGPGLWYIYAIFINRRVFP